MNPKTHTFHLALAGSLCAMLVLSLLLTRSSHALPFIEECVGQPYKTEGCPLDDDIEQTVVTPVSPLCGNGVEDAGEECDLGRFNGLSEMHARMQISVLWRRDCLDLFRGRVPSHLSSGSISKHPMDRWL